MPREIRMTALAAPNRQLLTNALRLSMMPVGLTSIR